MINRLPQKTLSAGAFLLSSAIAVFYKNSYFPLEKTWGKCYNQNGGNIGVLLVYIRSFMKKQGGNMKKAIIMISCISLLALTGCEAVDNSLMKLAGIKSDADYKAYQEKLKNKQIDDDGNYISDEFDDELVIPDGSIHVSFFENRNIRIDYFYDAQFTRPIDIYGCYIDPGDSIYASVSEVNNPDSTTYDFSEFKVFRYDEAGTRYAVDIGHDNKNVITIPEDFSSTEIAVEPVGFYPNRQIAFSDEFTDNNGESSNANGSWFIDNKKYDTDTAEISSAAGYSVSYEYDPDMYYFVDSAPKAFFYSDEKGKVIFADTVNDTDEYSVKLHKYTAADIDIHSPGLSEIKLNNEAINDGNKDRLKKLRAGDVLKFTTDTKNTVYSEELDVKPDAISNGYIFTFIIPDDAEDKYEFKVRGWLEKEKVHFEVEESSIWKKALSIMSLGREDEDKLLNVDNGEDTFTYLDLKNGKDIPLKEINDLIISATPEIEKFRNLVFKVSVNGRTPQYIINKSDKIRLRFSEVDTVKIDVCKGFVFNEKEIKNNYEGLTLHYYVDGKEAADGQFIEEGKTVSIKAECKDGVTVTGGAIGAGKLSGEVVIKSDTQIKDLVVNADSDGSFVYRASDFKYAHGSIIFRYKGDVIADGQRLGRGSEITYEAASADSGYWLPDGEHKIFIEGEDQAKEEMRAIRFYKHEKRNVKLIRTEHGGVIKYTQNGKVLTGTSASVYCGSVIEMSFTPWSGWSTDNFDNIKYIVTEEENQIVKIGSSQIDNELFREAAEHKPKLTVKLGSSVGKATSFSVIASGAAPVLKAKTDNKLIDKTIFEDKIGTEKGFTITAEEGALIGGEQIRLDIGYKYSDKTTANVTRYIRKLPGSVTVNIYDSNYERQNKTCTEINVEIGKVKDREG